MHKRSSVYGLHFISPINKPLLRLIDRASIAFSLSLAELRGFGAHGFLSISLLVHVVFKAAFEAISLKHEIANRSIFKRIKHKKST